jgi:hypothetical protein
MLFVVSYDKFQGVFEVKNNLTGFKNLGGFLIKAIPLFSTTPPVSVLVL